MRIVYVTERMPFGRGESFIIPEVKGLLHDGHSVLILPLGKADPSHGSASEPLLPLAHVISLLSPKVAASVIWSCSVHPVRIARVAWLLRKSSSLKQFCRNIIALLKGVRAAVLASRWGADHVHSHWANYTATVAMTVGELTDIPWSFTAHRYDIVANNLLAEKGRRAAFARYISRSGQELAAKRTNGEAFIGSHVLHMGVSIPRRIASEGVASPPKFACVASLVPVKGHRFLIEAVALLRRRRLPCELLLIGDGPLRNALIEQIAEANLEGSVKLLGQMPHDDVLSLYSTANISGAVLASLDLGNGVHEGIPVALLEAMSYGLPVISTNTGGIPELLHGGAGILVPPADPESLADAMRTIIECPVSTRQLRLAARRRVEESFDIAFVCKQLGQLFGNATG